MNHKLSIETYPQEGDFQHTYSALKNLVLENGEIGFFRVKGFGVDLKNPVTLQCQPSYDGTVNLIINDDKNPPRIVNSRFSKIEDNRFKVVNRNQKDQTNLYKWDKWDSQTRLFRTSVTLPCFNFLGINYFGQLKGGNYTFYAKFADNDYNQTDVLCESSIISIFKGHLDDLKSISGALSDELTNKSIRLKISNIDTSFSKIYLYYTREYSDLNGFRLSETKALVNPYDITGSIEEIIINGYEATEDIDVSELNVKYHYVNAVKTQAQVQNRLFFGNVQNNFIDVDELQNISYFFKVTLTQEKSVGFVDPNSYYAADSEYYSPHNIYYNLGYWPGEIYRLGVVYVMNDDSLSPVFNLRGCVFENVGDSNFDDNIPNVPIKYWSADGVNKIERNSFLTNYRLCNSYGIFRNAAENLNTEIINHENKTTKPWCYQITLDQESKNPDTNFTTGLHDLLFNLGVKGYFFVRQKRIPTTLCQGLSVGIDTSAHIPCIMNSSGKYITEGFLKENFQLSNTYTNLSVDKIKVSHSGLLSVDAMLNPSIQSSLDGSKFNLQLVKEGSSRTMNQQDKRRFVANSGLVAKEDSITKQCVYVNSDIPYKYINGYEFSSRAGNAESVKEYSYFGKNSGDIKKLDQKQNSGDKEQNAHHLIRGIYAPYIGVCGQLSPNSIYNVRIPNYSNLYTKEYFIIRANDYSDFFAISDRIPVESTDIHSIYRGDCYTNTVTIRLNRNFTDPDAPIQDVIVDYNTWKDNYKGKNKMEDVPFDQEEEADPGQEALGNWTRINRSDVNAVQLGTWVTYKCLSNYNLGLRSEDSTYPNEEALVGNKRTFYPLSDLNIKSSGKIPESAVLNNGYSATVGRKSNIIVPSVPYTKDVFDTRIMFSNVNVEGDFKNGYRVFQGMSYKDVDRQYGAIVKLLDWGTNLLCVFEHGIGIIPINEKALISTSTEQSIHMYGAGVLQSQVSLISPDYGSIWPESIIRTPLGIYGVDTYAKKIWRYTTEKGFETISDMKVQRFLNDHILLNESDKYPIISLLNVKSHYNNYKGDVMFTFYNKNKNEEWHLCFNERMDKWITRYSWTPLCSENINNIFYSLDKKRTEILSMIYYNKNCIHGIRSSNNLWDARKFNDEYIYEGTSFETKLTIEGCSLMTHSEMEIESIRFTYMDGNDEKEFSLRTDSWDQNSFYKIVDFYRDVDNKTYILNIGYNNLKNTLKKLPLGEIGIPLSLIIKLKGKALIQSNSGMSIGMEVKDEIGVVINPEYLSANDHKLYDVLLGNGFYVHGRAGVFDEIDYTDQTSTNQITPTKWYDKQEPFEFEFVVNEDVGLHKIFENLVIISNRVQPKSLEFEITGDVYSLFKDKMYGVFDRSLKSDTEVQFKNAIYKFDPILNQKTLVVSQDCKDVEQFRRRLGNIHYKEDSWYITIDPIIRDNVSSLKRTTTRIRDKYLKIRVKYSGEDLVVITAIKNLYTLTHN